MLLVTQESVLFSHSLRFNLDPAQKYADCELINALEKTGVVCDSNFNLDTVIDENLKLSAGQKKLIVIARGLLKNCKIVCLDEVTSNLDVESDEKITNMLYSEFKSATIIHISHRLENLKQCDLIICLKNGYISEMDSL
ncbi:ABC transporter C family member 8 [Thelohanellus kitauei]|uniref:ABC transporter C family member 8 n=1 Tax=Thelohanellus kitauei TaxID=669202 RepID=A0A0C2MAL1_THEKT|nr:ABC transporter C family member 8 [Thelohanellus kitauei]